MNRASIRKQLSGHGPIVVRTSDGKECPVPHSEFVLVGRHNLVIENEAGAFDIFDPLHIVSIRPPGKQKVTKNGH